MKGLELKTTYGILKKQFLNDLASIDTYSHNTLSSFISCSYGTMTGPFLLYRAMSLRSTSHTEEMQMYLAGQ